MALLRFEGVTFGYSRHQALFDGLTHTFGENGRKRGHVIAIMGASGCGKTTLLRLAAGLERPGAGRVLYHDPVDPVASYLPQKPVLFEHLSRRDNAEYYRRIQARRDRFDEDLFDALVERLRLASVLNAPGPVAALSGGEGQRLCLLRSLSIRPHVLFLDEPCTGLDVPVRNEFLGMLREIVDDQGLLVLYVTHHADEARLVADEVAYLQRREHGAVSLFQRRLNQIVEAPPTLEAAHLIADSPLNVVDCWVDGSLGGFSPGSRDFRIDPAAPPGRYQLVFSPGVLDWNSTSGLVVLTTGRSDRYDFVSFGGNGHRTRLVAPTNAAATERLRLLGPALLFRSPNHPGQRVVLGPP